MDRLNILIASDSFKGSLSSKEVANSIVKGLERAKDKIDYFLNYKILEIADGGEGTVEAITNGLNGEILEFEVRGVFNNKTKAIIGKIDNKTCIIETASPCGLDKINSNQLDPMRATSYGIGELIIHAIELGFNKIYIGLGGSATNDGGLGLAQALGAKMTDKNNKDVEFGAIGLKNLKNIDLSNIDKRLNNIEFILLSDVKNTLVGKEGATAIYGPQKGVAEDDIEIIDSWMKNYGRMLEQITRKEIINVPSSGAAGGIGAALIGLTNAKVENGIESIIKILDIENEIKKSDIIFTGEGKMDGQSIYGKAPIGISNLAKKYNKPVFAIVGSKGEDYQVVLDHGIDIVLDIIDKPMSLEYALDNASDLIANQAYSAIRLYNSIKNK